MLLSVRRTLRLVVSSVVLTLYPSLFISELVLGTKSTQTSVGTGVYGVNVFVTGETEFQHFEPNDSEFTQEMNIIR